jgi:hypothetical protein
MLVRSDEESTRAPTTPKLRLPHSRARLGGLAVSVALHALLIGVLVAHGEELWTGTRALGDPAPKNGGRSSGGGGNRVAYITLPSLPEPAATTPRVPPPVPAPRRMVSPVPEPVPDKAPHPEPLDTATVAPASAAPAGGENGAGVAAGPGAGDSGGLGAGPGTGAGAGPGGGAGRARPPEPRDLAFPFDPPPKELRGASLSVTFWVRVDGRVERYEVEPEIKDRDYAKKFDEVMRAFRFTPARAPDGTRVAGTTKISFTLPGKSSS